MCTELPLSLQLMMLHSGRLFGVYSQIYCNRGMLPYVYICGDIICTQFDLLSMS